MQLMKTGQDIVENAQRVQDQVVNLRAAVNAIKQQDPGYKQYIQEKVDNINQTLEEAGLGRITKELPKSEQRAPLSEDQKAAYAAVEKLDKLVRNVEKFDKLGMITSILKGQVRNHLEAMNKEPLKTQITDTIGKASQKTEVVSQAPKR